MNEFEWEQFLVMSVDQVAEAGAVIETFEARTSLVESWKRTFAMFEVSQSRRSRLKVPTRAFTIKNLFRHYAKQELTLGKST